MKAPRVSVVVPTHDARETLVVALDSLAAQTLLEMEVIVVDDASTDDTPTLARDWAAAHPACPTRVVSLPINAGPGVARNRGIAEARAPLVAFLDADDRATPDRLEAQATVLDAHPDHALVGGWFQIVDGTGQVLAERRSTMSPTMLAWAATLHAPIQNSTLMIRRDAVPADGGLFAETWQGEADLAYRHLFAQGPGGILPKVVCQYRTAGESASARRHRAVGRRDERDLTAEHVTKLIHLPLDRTQAAGLSALITDFPGDGGPGQRELVELFLLVFLAFKRKAPVWCDREELADLESTYMALAAPVLAEPQ